MKLFGSRRDHRRSSGANRYETQSSSPREEEKDNSPSKASKAILYLIASASMFVFSLVLIFSLINKSGAAIEIPVKEPTVPSLNYQINVSTPIRVDTDIEIEPLVSKYGSDRINLLFIVPNDSTKSTDAVILLSLDMKNSTVSMLSVPRDTYIAGNYEDPKMRHVYHSAEGGKKGAEAVREMLRGMMGFAADHYIVLNKDALSLMVAQSEEVRFTVPEEPAYSLLPAGERVFKGDDAMQLFSYKNDYTDVETDPPRIQRQFLQVLLKSFTAGEDMVVAERITALMPTLVTDLNEKQMTYLALLLQDMDLYSAYSRALPGGEIEVDDLLYYQVDIEMAVEMLNEQFSPLTSELDEFDVNFRQLTGDSGDGEYSDYGFSDSTESTASGDDDDDNSDDDTTDPNETEDPDETEDPESTEDTEDTSEPDETEAPPEETEAPPQESTETP